MHNSIITNREYEAIEIKTKGYAQNVCSSKKMMQNWPLKTINQVIF